ncbi:MAG: hypothetical protein ACREQJ_05150, partial [Candidatus Binatia bacterium]
MATELGRQEPKRGRLGSRLVRILLALVALAVVVFAFIKFERSRPTIELGKPVQNVGERGEVTVVARDRGTGLAHVDVALEASGTRFELASEDYPTTGWRGGDVKERVLELTFKPREAKIPEGEARLVVRAEDHSWLNFFLTRRSEFAQPVTVDYSPPRIEILTAQHYMRLGGSDLVVFKASPDAVKIGVQVESYYFPGEKGLFPDKDVAVGLFAVPQDLTTTARPKVVAEDAAGNRREVGFYVSIKPQKFRERELDITDDFLQATIPDLLRVNGLPANPDLV